MGDKAWKAFERKVAKDLGTKRVLEKGRAVPDAVVQFSENRGLCVDAKNRKHVNARKAIATVMNYTLDLDGIFLSVVCWRKPGKKAIHAFMPFCHLQLFVQWSKGNFACADITQISFIVCINYDDFKKLFSRVKKWRLGSA